MTTITKEDVVNLREKTGAGLIDCKRALTESGGDFEEAVSILRKKGVASAAKKAGRSADEGIIAQSISDDRKTGVLVEVNCETDFVAKNEDFIAFSDEVAKELLSNPDTADAKKMPDFVQKTIKDLHSESEDIKKMKLEAESFDEKEFLKSELNSMGQKEFGVDIEVYSESDDNIYDPKGKARHARPFKPAILIE